MSDCVSSESFVPAVVKPVRVALILRYFLPIVTGPAVRHRQIAEVIRRYGIHMEFHTAMPDGHSLPFHEDCRGYEIFRHTFTGTCKPGQQQLDAALFKAATNYWQSTGPAPDVIVVFTASRKILPQLLWARMNGAKVVLSLTIAPETGETSRLREILTRLTQYGMLRLFDAHCALSESLGRIYCRLGASPKKMHVFPFPVNMQRFRPPSCPEEKAAIRNKLGLPQNRQIVLFMGGIIRRKGVDLLLKAWGRVLERHPGALLVLAGEEIRRSTSGGVTGLNSELFFKQEISHLIQSTGISEAVMFAGEVDNPEEYCRASDVFAFPSRLEGMGGVIPEAMASGLPCVITPFVGFPEKEFGIAGTHYVKAELEAGSIAEALCLLLSDSVKRHEMGLAARSWAAAEFELMSITRRLAQLYLRLAQQPQEFCRDDNSDAGLMHGT
jgi:glycosyltransferase involved in cell wall biosynthesis